MKEAKAGKGGDLEKHSCEIKPETPGALLCSQINHNKGAQFPVGATKVSSWGVGDCLILLFVALCLVQ